MAEILLDRVGDARLPVGYKEVTNEVEFLRLATSGAPLLVRGAALTHWAQVFFEGRQVSLGEAISPAREIQAFCPTMSLDDVQALVQRLGSRFFEMPRPLAPESLLYELYANRIWHEPRPDARHGAEWLLWLYESKPERWLQPLLRLMGQRWQEAATDGLELVYAATDSDSALTALEGWLRLTLNPLFARLGEFPLSVPTTVQGRAHTIWREQAVATRGAFFEQVAAAPIPFGLKRLAAQEAVRYYLNQPQHLTQAALDLLGQFLSHADLQGLRKRLPPAKPGPLPAEPEAVLRWFAGAYLPYRMWQSENQIAQAEQPVSDAAGAFSRWYLDRYPKALMGGATRELLSFTQAGDAVTPNAATLLIVLDGLHAGDARRLEQKMRASTSRLALISDRLLFAPIPTVTDFCKPALLTGVPSARAAEMQPIGTVLPEDNSPIHDLQQASPGKLYIWRIQEPDRTYHRHNGRETLLRDVEAQLDAAANKIVDLVEQVRDDLSLQIIITTDHGRLLAKSPRSVQVPSGMVSHGRAAWGNSGRSFDATGYKEEAEVIFIHGARFGLAQDVAVVAGADTFQTNDGKGGVEVHPHGGLYPEEVIVPWISFARDVELPKLAISAQGDGTAGKQGRIVLTVTNLGDVDVILEEVQLRFAKQAAQILPCTATFAVGAAQEVQVDVTPWPTSDAAREARIYLRVRLPNGLSFDLEAPATLHSQDMYDRGEDILEGLDL